MSGWTTNGVSLATLPLSGSEQASFDTQLTDGLTPQTEAISTSQLFQYVGGGNTVPWVAGRYYGLPNSTTPVAVLTVASTLYAYPLYIPETEIDTINVSVTTGQTGGACRIGIYADNGAGYPGALVYDSGAISGLTSTTVVTHTPTSNIVLNSGLYWIASIFTATSTMPSVIGVTAAYTNPLMAQLGADTAANALATSAKAPTGISVAGTYGALPETFTSGATLTQNAATPAFAFLAA